MSREGEARIRRSYKIQEGAIQKGATLRGGARIRRRSYKIQEGATSRERGARIRRRPKMNCKSL